MEDYQLNRKIERIEDNPTNKGSLDLIALHLALLAIKDVMLDLVREIEQIKKNDDRDRRLP